MSSYVTATLIFISWHLEIAYVVLHAYGVMFHVTSYPVSQWWFGWVTWVPTIQCAAVCLADMFPISECEP